jgi:hypothetical protein
MVNVNDMPMEMADELAFSKEEMEELKAARGKPIVFDEDCPETTPEKALKFHRVNPPRGTNARRAYGHYFSACFSFRERFLKFF